MEEIEIWKDVPEYEGYYQVSNLGRVRSVDRLALNGFCMRKVNSRILKSANRSGYRIFSIKKNGTARTMSVHQLVAIAFLGHTINGNTLVIDHIDGDKTNNRLSNLHVVTSRENNSICFKKNKEKYSSEFTGVSFFKRDGNWESYITTNRKRKYLGRFPTELEAHNAYQNELKMQL